MSNHESFAGSIASPAKDFDELRDKQISLE